MSTIKKKKDNTGYETRLSLGVDPVTGKRIQRYLSSRTKTGLLEKITKTKMKYFNGDLETEPLKITFEMLAEEYLNIRLQEVADGHISRTTYVGEKSHFTSDFIPYFKNTRVDKIDLPTLKTFQTYLKNQPKRNIACKDGIYNDDEIVLASHTTVNKKIKKFKKFLQYAFDKGYIPHFNLSSVRNLPQVKKEMKFWTPQEFIQFMNVVNLEENDIRIKTFYTLAYTTGARLSELLACNINDIDFMSKRWYIHSAIVYDSEKKEAYVKQTTKTKSSTRYVKIDDFTFELLQQVIDIKISDYLFMYSAELPKASYYTDRFKNYIPKADVKRIRFHDLRHSHASLLIANGEDRFTVSKRLGHSSTMFTETVYGHLFPDKQDKITSLLEATLKVSVQ